MPSRAHGHAIHAGHTHGRTAPVPVGETRNRSGRPENDVKVDATDDGGQGDTQGAPEASAPEHGAVGAKGPRKTTRNRPSHRKPASRPGTGADTGFADADDPALPPEAAAAIKEAGELQNSAGQAAGPRNTTPGTGAPGTTAPGAAPGAAPGNTAPQGAAPAGAPSAPKGTIRNRPANSTTDRSTNQTSTGRAGRSTGSRMMPVAFFNSGPAVKGSRLVLHTVAGTSPQHTVVLQCDPTGGTHPKAAEACADVAKAGGDLAQMPANAKPQACFMIYAPVTVTAQGKWQGQPVRFTKKYPNTCVMHDKTGSVFDF